MFELAMPWALVMIIVPWVLWLLLPKAKESPKSALKVPFYLAISNLIANKTYLLGKKSQITILYLIWVLLVLALAGPRWVGAPLPVERDGYNIMLALDISGSMEVNDLSLDKTFW